MSERTLLANEHMSIYEACNEVGMDVYQGTNAKFYCPFGHLFHKDGGHSKAFRIYPESNSAYCFACPQYFTPVSLIAADRNLELDDAAEVVLQLAGYQEPALEERWETARTIVQPPVDTSGLATALAIYCARIDPTWSVSQFEEPQATVFRKCVELTSAVRTDEDVQLWLTKTKQAMKNVLTRA